MNLEKNIDKFITTV